jgi:outer membrane protein
MKKLLLLVLATLAIGFSVNAQKKMGYLNSQELLGTMPEYKKVNEELEAYYKQMESDFAVLTNEYQAKVKEYQDKEKTYSESMKEVKVKEIQSIEQRIQEFRQSSQEKLGKKESDLVEPLLKKIHDAITAVGKENNFDYIYNESALLYAKDSEDITTLVKAKLGIK